MTRFVTLVTAAGWRLGVNLDQIVSIEPSRHDNRETTHAYIALVGGGFHEIKANSEKLTAEMEKRAQADRGARQGSRSLFDEVFGPLRGSR